MKIFKKTNSITGRLTVALFCVSITITMLTGCGTTPVFIEPENEIGGEMPAERIRISALTEFVRTPDKPNQIQLKALVEVLDARGKPVKIDCAWRFELYEYLARSSNPRGWRLIIWPDYDLSVSDVANQYWKEFLQGYEFFLPLNFVPQLGKKYVFEATCVTNQRRYSDLFEFTYQP